MIADAQAHLKALSSFDLRNLSPSGQSHQALSARSGWLRATSKMALSSIQGCALRHTAISSRSCWNWSPDRRRSAAFLSKGTLTADTCGESMQAQLASS
jgi:hypothetical protein